MVGLFIRNPIIPALLLYGWEWLNFLLPPLLKKVSVIHYLNSGSGAGFGGPFAVVADPTPADRDSKLINSDCGCAAFVRIPDKTYGDSLWK